jgi:dTMP kinase
VRQEFLQIARLDPERYLVVDGTHTIEQIHQEIINRVSTIPAISHIVKTPKMKTPKKLSTTIKNSKSKISRGGSTK